MRAFYKSWKFPLSIGCLVLGILIAVQFRGQQQQGFPLSTYRTSDLIRMLKDSQEKIANLEETLSSKRTHLAAYESNEKGGTETSRSLLEELQKSRLEAGMIPVKGPGVQVVLNDSNRRPSPQEDDYFYLVHDVDLIQLENELWSAGAEAVSINGQRLVAESSIRCVGPTILVNTLRLSPPYRVEAIGDPDTLSTALKMHGGFMDTMGISIAHGVSMIVTKEKQVNIPAFGGIMSFKYASPDLKQ